MITFLVVHTQRLSCTQRCLKAISATTPEPYRIILLVQGPQTKKTHDYLEGLPTNIEKLHFDENIWLLPARKLLAGRIGDEGSGMYLDNDVFLWKDWFDPIPDVFNEMPRNVIGCSLVMHSRQGTALPSIYVYDKKSMKELDEFINDFYIKNP